MERIKKGIKELAFLIRIIESGVNTSNPSKMWLERELYFIKEIAADLYSEIKEINKED